MNFEKQVLQSLKLVLTNDSFMINYQKQLMTLRKLINSITGALKNIFNSEKRLILGNRRIFSQ